MQPVFDPNTGETVLVPVSAPVLPKSDDEHLAPETKPGRKKRRSIANDNPRALEEALNDPTVHEIVDLFGGKVVDIHRRRESNSVWNILFHRKSAKRLDLCPEVLYNC